MSGWEQVAGSSEKDPLTLATSGEKQQWSFHDHVFEFECRLVPHDYPMIPNGVGLEIRIAETVADGPEDPIALSTVVIAGRQGAEVADDFDEYARIGIQEQARGVFAYAGKRVLAQEELQRLAAPDSPEEES
jgi:hypothetical protein